MVVENTGDLGWEGRRPEPLPDQPFGNRQAPHDRCQPKRAKIGTARSGRV
jgi:hypothetical protein